MQALCCHSNFLSTLLATLPFSSTLTALELRALRRHFRLTTNCSCISSRRRRRRGVRPYYGTGWAGQPPWRHGQAAYNPNYNYQQPQPAYNQGQQQYGGYYGGPPSYYQSSQPTGDGNRGYYGAGHGGNQDFEMQSPQRVYQSQAPEVSGAKK